MLQLAYTVIACDFELSRREKVGDFRCNGFINDVSRGQWFGGAPQYLSENSTFFRIVKLSTTGQSLYRQQKDVVNDAPDHAIFN